MIYDDIKHLVGIPWVYKKSDCWAIFKMASKLIGREVKDLRLPENSCVIDNINIFYDEMKSDSWTLTSSVNEGCAVVFFDRRDRPLHIGFALNSDTVLHSMGSNTGVSSSSCDNINSLIKKGFYKRYEVYYYNI